MDPRALVVPLALAILAATSCSLFLPRAEKMQRWDRTTLGVAQMIPYPRKLTGVELVPIVLLELAKVARSPRCRRSASRAPSR